MRLDQVGTRFARWTRLVSPAFMAVGVVVVVGLAALGCSATAATKVTTVDAYGGDAASAAPSTGGPAVDMTKGPDTGSTTGDGDVSISNPRVQLKTSMGTIELELDATAAPITVDNFLSYVRDGFYDGTIFHRVIPGFMAQGGGFTPDFQQKPTKASIKNEAGNGLKNLRGTVAMARTGVVDSATAQFFVNLVDNAFLDHTGESPQSFGYAVFGMAVSGMDVVDAMAAVPTKSAGPFQDVPQTPIVIESATVVNGE